MREAGPSAAAYILRNVVFHARYLPTPSKHAFTYPTLALLLSLSALESHKLDLGYDKLFGYSDPGASFALSRCRLTGIRPETYLHDPSTYRHMKGKPIRKKLEVILNRYNIDANELDDTWMLTMPSYLGIEGINPLTIFYCYKKGDDKLWVVVLEVHNTFGERHVYVLPTGSRHEEKSSLPGFSHSWTFPRQFHVSPFNDRSGYYTCCITAPPHPPPPERSTKSSTCDPCQPPLPKILIQFWTPESQLKLIASLRSTSAVPLSPRNLFLAISEHPFTLLLTFVRIAWQAFHLHFYRRLDVYARPEPRAIDPLTENDFLRGSSDDKEGSSMMSNDVQRSEDGELFVGGGIGWQPEGLLERYARTRVECFLEKRAQDTDIRIRLLSTNPAHEPVSFPRTASNSGTTRKELTLVTRCPRCFLLILASPSPAYALLLAKRTEQLLQVSDHQLFLEVFSLPTGHGSKHTHGSVMMCRILQRLRRLPLRQTHLLDSTDRSAMEEPSIHPLDMPYSHSGDEPASHSLLIQNFLVLVAFLGITYFEGAIFTLLKARFVKGTEPWGIWERARLASATRKTVSDEE